VGVRRRLPAGRPPLLLLMVPLLLRLRLLLWLAPPLVPLSLRFHLSPLQQLLPKPMRFLLLLRFRLPPRCSLLLLLLFLSLLLRSRPRPGVWPRVGRNPSSVSG
jgi:hypothetical protein